MAREKNPKFRCTECSHEALRWMGQCPACNEWNSLEEISAGGATPRRRDRVGDTPTVARPVESWVGVRSERIPVEPPEFSNVLGGGLVPGSLVLLGGAPGVGKSTLLTMLAGQIAKAQGPVVYLSAEESGDQVRRRAVRLGATHEDFLLIDKPALEQVLPQLVKDPPRLLIVDSIQAVLSEEIDGLPGGITQIRACGSMLSDFARLSGCAVLLIGHVTKDGDLAGPRLLEHLVDTVLYFEPEAGGRVRILRAFKNRFGSTGELAIMEMLESGLRPVRDASALFLAGRKGGEAGSCVSAILSGSRPFLVELQALLVESQYATPTRVVTGTDAKRVAQLAAVLARKGGMGEGGPNPVSGKDIYIKVAGGLRVNDPATDLALLAAMASSLLDRPLPADRLVLGEVGLTGELRPIHSLQPRLAEAAAHGFSDAVVGLPDGAEVPKVDGLKIHVVGTLREALRSCFTKQGRAIA